MFQIAFLLLLLSGFAAFMGFGAGLGSRHATCCVIMPPIGIELDRLASEGIIDVDRAAASMKLPAWSEPTSPDAASADARETYEQDTMRRLSFVLGDVPAKEWTDSKLLTAKVLFAFAAACFVACVIAANLAIRTPKFVVAATPLPKAAAEGV